MSFRAPAMRWVLAATCIAAPALAAQNQPAPGPRPDCSAAEYRQLDFWVGEWNVTISGRQVGTNVITREEKGCLVHEHWRDARGGTGQSFNYFDRADRKWHQVWVADNGAVLDLAGTYADGKLTYTGESAGPGGGRAMNELSFSPNPDGTVRQFWRVSTDSGATWRVVWDGLYTRRAAR